MLINAQRSTPFIFDAANRKSSIWDNVNALGAPAQANVSKMLSPVPFASRVHFTFIAPYRF
ncbi:MAG: hypothetical protein PUP92_25880 [Rhizonema sp. PD38]|nr:hypothetical protein [Rhizonema sp. PD38]